MPTEAGSEKCIALSAPACAFRIIVAAPVAGNSVRVEEPAPVAFMSNDTSPAPSGITEAGDCKDDPPPPPPDPATAHKARPGFANVSFGKRDIL